MVLVEADVGAAEGPRIVLNSADSAEFSRILPDFQVVGHLLGILGSLGDVGHLAGCGKLRLDAWDGSGTSYSTGY